MVVARLNILYRLSQRFSTGVSKSLGILAHDRGLWHKLKQREMEVVPDFRLSHGCNGVT